MSLFVKRLRWIFVGFEWLWVPAREQLVGPRSRLEPELALIRRAVTRLLVWLRPRLTTILTVSFVAGWVADVALNLWVHEADFAS
jgi:hypothetical protein